MTDILLQRENIVVIKRRIWKRRPLEYLLCVAPIDSIVAEQQARQALRDAPKSLLLYR